MNEIRGSTGFAGPPPTACHTCGGLTNRMYTTMLYLGMSRWFCAVHRPQSQMPRLQASRGPIAYPRNARQEGKIDE